MNTKYLLGVARVGVLNNQNIDLTLSRKDGMGGVIIVSLTPSDISMLKRMITLAQDARDQGSYYVDGFTTGS